MLNSKLAAHGILAVIGLADHPVSTRAKGAHARRIIITMHGWVWWVYRRGRNL